MFTLQNLNVVRIVTTEAEKQKLIKQGFKEITDEAKTEEVKLDEVKQEEVKNIEGQVTEGKTK